MELIEILEEIGCLTFDSRMVKPAVKSSPFQRMFFLPTIAVLCAGSDILYLYLGIQEEEVLFLIPTQDGLERFAAFIEQMDRTTLSEV